ncbi:MAG: helix-turn-helix transcriptional regulator [Clostridia bacterium]|nr:helix-turn-helix transcriptional regulator [Clostridia bacterium]
METFGDRLKSLRKSKDIGQIELAQALGVSKGIISLWENNLREPTLSNIIAIIKFFNEPADYVLGLTD